MRRSRFVAVVLLVAGCQSEAPPDPEPEAGRPADFAALDAALRDLVTNPDLARSREFYGEPFGGRVLYDPATFPEGFAPVVPGFRFEPFDPAARVYRSADPRALAVDLRWFRGRPTLPPGRDDAGYNQRSRERYGTWGGIELFLYNAGGLGGGAIRIGECGVAYEVGPGPVVSYKALRRLQMRPRLDDLAAEPPAAPDRAGGK